MVMTLGTAALQYCLIPFDRFLFNILCLRSLRGRRLDLEHAEMRDGVGNCAYGIEESTRGDEECVRDAEIVENIITSLYRI